MSTLNQGGKTSTPNQGGRTSTLNQGRKTSTSHQSSKPASTGRGKKQTTSGGLVDLPPEREGACNSTWTNWYQRILGGLKGEPLSPKGLPIQSGLHRQDGRPSAKFTTAWMVKTHPHAISPLRLCGPTILELILGH